jgi:hypothetical protein
MWASQIIQRIKQQTQLTQLDVTSFRIVQQVRVCHKKLPTSRTTGSVVECELRDNRNIISI